MESIWRDTANQGRVLFLKEQGREIAHVSGGERSEALSLWEGIAGYAPPGRFAFWKWKRGLIRIEHGIRKLVREGERLSA